MSDKRTVFNTPLADQIHETWANSILMRLAAAIGMVDKDNPGPIDTDPDVLLEHVEQCLLLLHLILEGRVVIDAPYAGQTISDWDEVELTNLDKALEVLLDSERESRFSVDEDGEIEDNDGNPSRTETKPQEVSVEDGPPTGHPAQRTPVALPE